MDLSKLTSEEVQKRDQEIYAVKEDPNFSPKRNREVVERSIQKYEAMRAARARAYEEQVGERSHAVASYLKSNVANNGDPIEKYLSPRELAHLRGQRRMEIVRRLKNGQEYRELIEL